MSDIPPKTNFMNVKEPKKIVPYPMQKDGTRDCSIEAWRQICVIENITTLSKLKHTDCNTFITIRCKGLDQEDPNRFCEREVTKRFYAYHKTRDYKCKSCLNRDKWTYVRTEYGNTVSEDTWLYGYTFESLHVLGEQHDVKIHYDELDSKNINKSTSVPFDCKKCMKNTSKTFIGMTKHYIFLCPKCKPLNTIEIRYDHNLLHQLRDENQLELRHESYDNFKLNSTSNIEFKCKGCDKWTTKQLLILYKGKVFYCENCFCINNGAIKYDRQLLEDFLLKFKLKLVAEPEGDINRDTPIHIRCKSNWCSKTIIRTFREWIESKRLYCDICIHGVTCADKVICCTKKAYDNFVIDYNPTIITKDVNLTRNQIMVGKCMIRECGKFYFKPMNKLYTNKLPYCDECSIIVTYNRNYKNKYSKEAVEKLFDKHNIEDYLIFKSTSEVGINTLICFECKTEDCNNTCSRKVGCLIETENMHCEHCSVNNREIIELNRTLFDTIIPVLYYNISFHDLTDIVDSDIILKHQCQAPNCKEMISKSFQKLIDIPEIYCKNHANGDNYYNRWMRMFIGKTGVKLDEEYKSICYGDKIGGHCLTVGCEGKFNKHVEDMIKHGLAYCEKCTLIIIFDRVYKTCLARYGVKYVMQDPGISQRSMENSMKSKKYILPDGATTIVQGYEDGAFDILLYEQGYKQEQIKNMRVDVPHIKYEFDEKVSTYYTDIYIPEEKRCIEVKSMWIYMLDLEKNWAKHDATIRDGYTHEFWILDEKRRLLEIIIDR